MRRVIDTSTGPSYGPHVGVPDRSHHRPVGPTALVAQSAAVLLVLMAGASGCTSSSKATSPATTAPVITAPTTTTLPSSTAQPPGATTVPPAIASAVQAAAVAYQTRQGVAPDSYVVSVVAISTVEATYALFRVSAARPGEQFQGGYGIAQERAGSWKVVAFGTAAVGCAPGPAVPSRVLTGFGLACAG